MKPTCAWFQKQQKRLMVYANWRNKKLQLQESWASFKPPHPTHHSLTFTPLSTWPSLRTPLCFSVMPTLTTFPWFAHPFSCNHPILRYFCLQPQLMLYLHTSSNFHSGTPSSPSRCDRGSRATSITSSTAFAVPEVIYFTSVTSREIWQLELCSTCPAGASGC